MRSLPMLLIALGPWSLSAQAPAPADSFKITFDLGYVNTAGNTDVSTLNFGENLSYRTGRWTLGHQLAVVEGRSEGQETAGQYSTALRLDRSLSARIGAYALGGYDRNVFAGISRRLQEGVGLTVKLVAAKNDALDAEAGVSMVQQRSTANIRESFGAGRGALAYQHAFTSTAFGRQTLEVLANLKHSADRRMNSETSLVAPLSSHVALKMTYALRIDNEPEPGFKKTDRVFTTGIQIAL